MKRRPTIIAAELPKLTDHQVAVMTDRYDIHGGVPIDNPESYGADLNAGEPDTTLPPSDPEHLKTRGNYPHGHPELGGASAQGSGENTRVPSLENGVTGEKAKSEIPRV